jgi:Short C-terminal domain
MFVFYPLMVVSIFMRRRPLARAAVVGGAAYYAGKRGAENSQREADQNAQIADLQAQQAYAQPQPAAAAPAAGGMSEDAIEKLKQLADLHTQGVLTDAEFEVQKQKILQGM